MVLDRLPVQGRPTNLDKSRARAYCACSRCGWGLFGHFSLVYHFSFLSPSLWETARYRLKYCLKGPLSPKQTNKPTNQPTSAVANHSEILAVLSDKCILTSIFDLYDKRMVPSCPRTLKFITLVRGGDTCMMPSEIK